MPYHRMAGSYGQQVGGFGSILSGIVGGVTSLATGNVGGAIQSVIGGFRNPTGSVTVTAPSRAPVGMPAPSTIIPPRTRFTGVSVGGPMGVQIGTRRVQDNSLYANANLPAATGCGTGAPSGYHLNKTGYYLKSGEYVPPGSRYVRNRSRNPANGKALRRAVSRVQSFNNVVKRSRKSLKRLSSI